MLPLSTAAGCGGASYVRIITVNPPEASLYINGTKVGQGNSRPYAFDFSTCERIFVQATHPDFQPATEEFDRAKIEALIAANIDVKISLRAR